MISSTFPKCGSNRVGLISLKRCERLIIFISSCSKRFYTILNYIWLYDIIIMSYLLLFCLLFSRNWWGPQNCYLGPDKKHKNIDLKECVLSSPQLYPYYSLVYLPYTYTHIFHYFCHSHIKEQLCKHNDNRDKE